MLPWKIDLRSILKRKAFGQMFLVNQMKTKSQPLVLAIEVPVGMDLRQNRKDVYIARR